MMKRIANIGFAACLLLFLAAVTWGTLFRNTGDYSYFENRALASKPALTAEGLVTGDYFDDWEEYLSDHALARTTLLKLNTWLELHVLKKPVISDVVVTEDYLLSYIDYGRWDISSMEADAAARAADFADLTAYIEEQGGVFCFVGVPEQFGYFAEKYPDWLENRSWLQEPLRKHFFGAMEAAGVPALNMGAVFDEQGHPDEYYAASDHHYAYAGAEATYRALIEKLNGEYGLNLSVTEMERQELPNPFLGSRNRKLNGLWRGEDSLTIGIPAEKIPFRRWDNGQEVAARVNHLPETEHETVTYGVYMGDDVAETIIRTDRPELPNALIFGDSFTNALETMLYTSFNETRSIDLRHYSEKSIREYIAEYQPDVVICLRDETAYLGTDGNGNLF